MRTTAAAGGLRPTGETSTAATTTFNQPPLRLDSTEETSLPTPILSVSHDSSFFWKKNPPAVPSCRRVIEAKSGQNRTFDPSGSQGRLRACLFLGTWRAFLCGKVMRVGAAGGDLQLFLEDRSLGIQNLQEWYRRNIYAVRIVVNRWLFETRPALNMLRQAKDMPSRAARGDRKLGANGCRGASWSEA